jgi:hypothetical protein
VKAQESVGTVLSFANRAHRPVGAPAAAAPLPRHLEVLRRLRDEAPIAVYQGGALGTMQEVYQAMRTPLRPSVPLTTTGRLISRTKAPALEMPVVREPYLWEKVRARASSWELAGAGRDRNEYKIGHRSICFNFRRRRAPQGGGAAASPVAARGDSVGVGCTSGARLAQEGGRNHGATGDILLLFLLLLFLLESQATCCHCMQSMPNNASWLFESDHDHGTVAAETLRRALTELLGSRRKGRCTRQLGRPRPTWAICCASRAAGKARRAN